jgi:superoxide dismutase, Cu-Zn family
MHHQRLLGSIVGVCAVGALIAGCGAGQATQPPAAPGETQPAAAHQTTAVFEQYKEGAKAITYSPAQIPVGANVNVSSERANGSTEITLELKGLQPNRDYGAHVHIKSCGPSGDDAGPHFQEKADPVKPSVDPAYANPQNEVWLDFHTDAQGNGTATAEGNWSFDTRQDAKSVVIHEMHTHSDAGKAGTAGKRLACINATF